MKKVCIIFLLSIIISLTALGLLGAFNAKTQNGAPMYATNAQTSGKIDEFLRIHIRADSNNEEAQAVKYYVRDKIVEHLTPFVASCPTKTQAMQGIRAKLKEISAVADKALREKGYSYGASAELTKEYFPTRVYDGYVLSSGEYSALIIRLGRGEGDNWWCVVYPPLCFSAPTGNNVVYNSKILEIIERFKQGK